MRIVFAGTPELSVVFLEALSRAHTVRAVITQPDRPRGRRRIISPPPVKVFAREKGIRVFQPEDISCGAFLRELDGFNPFILAVVSYGKIFKKPLLALPSRGCINLHLSLLPKYRGPCPVEWALINGEKVSGVTCILMDEGMDTGRIILKSKVEISDTDTKGSLQGKLAAEGIKVMLESIDMMLRGAAKPAEQEGPASYAPFLRKKDRDIDWREPAVKIHNRVRALNPHPGARSRLEGSEKKIILWKTGVKSASAPPAPGQILETSKDASLVATGDGLLRVETVQPEGGKKQNISDFLRGHRVERFA